MVRIFTPDKNVDMERLCAVDGKQIGAVQSKDLCSKYIYSFFLTSRKKKTELLLSVIIYLANSLCCLYEQGLSSICILVIHLFQSRPNKTLHRMLVDSLEDVIERHN